MIFSSVYAGSVEIGEKKLLSSSGSANLPLIFSQWLLAFLFVTLVHNPLVVASEILAYKPLTAIGLDKLIHFCGNGIGFIYSFILRLRSRPLLIKRRGLLARGIKRQWVCWQRQFSVFSLVISSETLEIRWALLYSDMQSVVGFSAIPKCVTANDLEWPFRVKFCFRACLSGFRPCDFRK